MLHHVLSNIDVRNVFAYFGCMHTRSWVYIPVDVRNVFACFGCMHIRSSPSRKFTGGVGGDCGSGGVGVATGGYRWVGGGAETRWERKRPNGLGERHMINVEFQK